MKKLPKKKFSPVDSVVPALRKLSQARTYRAFFMRKSVHRLMERLTDQEIDAMIQIAIGIRVSYGGLVNYRQFKYGELPGISASEYNDFVLDVLKRFRVWQELMAKDHTVAFSVCKAICDNDKTFAELAIEHGERSERYNNIIGLLRVGLLEWCLIAGWNVKLPA